MTHSRNRTTTVDVVVERSGHVELVPIYVSSSLVIAAAQVTPMAVCLYLSNIFLRLLL